MSKVRLTGSTSGYTEIQAAAVAGDNTITLPTTASGTLLASDASGNVNIDSGTLYVDATNNRVGVGTTSPSTILSVSGASQITHNYTGAGGSLALGQFNTSGDASINLTVGANLLFATNNTERARIDSSGRLLVGTSSSILSYAKIQVQGGLADPGGHICLANETASPGSGANIGSIRFTNNAGGIGAIVNAEADGAWTAGSNYRTRLVFSTTADGASSPTERVRIDNAGRVLIGQTSTGLQNGRSIAWQGSGEGTLYISHGTNDGNGDAFIKFGYSTTQIGSITQSGTTAVAYNTSSDYRLKENVVAVSDGITRLQQLKPSRFNFIANPDTTVDGFLAHEVQSVVPEAITGEKDAVDADGNPVYQGIDQSKLVPLLTAALQEAVAKIESLEARLTAAGI